MRINVCEPCVAAAAYTIDEYINIGTIELIMHDYGLTNSIGTRPLFNSIPLTHTHNENKKHTMQCSPVERHSVRKRQQQR